MFKRKGKSYLDYLKELENLEIEDRETFLKLKSSKEIHCDIYDKLCLFVTGRDDTCFKKCKYYKKTIRPLENKSLKLLVKIEKKKQEITEKFGDLDNMK